jgi:carboxymethylenebutenolidase
MAVRDGDAIVSYYLSFHGGPMKREIVILAAIAGAAYAVPAFAQHVHGDAQAQAAPQAGPPAGAPGRGPQTPPIDVPWDDSIPAGTADHAARALKESPRHGEWADIKLADGTILKSWVVYPERSTKTGVVLVIHDIRGMADITRAVGDQLAQDGFIAIVPDFLSGKGPNGGGTESLGAGVGQAIQGLTPADVNTRLTAAMEYGKKLPASNGKTGVVGFCWGGARSFGFAAAQPALNAAVVYYGDAPGASDGTVETQLANVKAPVLGLYAGNDARIGATIPATEAAMRKLGKSYEVHTFEGAGHGFMGNQAGAGGANLKAAKSSWPLVVQFFAKNLK